MPLGPGCSSSWKACPRAAGLTFQVGVQIEQRQELAGRGDAVWRTRPKADRLRSRDGAADVAKESAGVKQRRGDVRPAGGETILLERRDDAGDFPLSVVRIEGRSAAGVAALT